MSYLEKHGLTEQEYDAVMNEAHDHFQSCRTMEEQQAQQLDCDFNMHTEGREPGDDDEPEFDDDADTREYDDERDPMFNTYPEDHHLDSSWEDRHEMGW